MTQNKRVNDNHHAHRNNNLEKGKAVSKADRM